MNTGQRIKELRKKLNISVDEMADKLGKNRATIYRYESNDIENMPASILEPLARILNTTPAELMGWTASDNKKIVKFHNFASVEGLFNYAHYPVGISAGQLQEVDSLYNVPKIPIPDVMMGRYARNKNICIMHVNGESMNNVIDDGAVIAVQRNIELSQLKNGDIVVADSGKGEYTVKRFYLQEDGVVLLRPDSSNISFTDIKIDIKNGEQVNIFGKVVIYNVIL